MRTNYLAEGVSLLEGDYCIQILLTAQDLEDYIAAYKPSLRPSHPSLSQLIQETNSLGTCLSIKR